MKRAAVNPLIRETSGQAMPRGDEVHSPLLRNPYPQGTEEAKDYENGYEFVQSAGHMALSQMGPEGVQRWKANPVAWRQGFAEAAAKLGLKEMGDSLLTAGQEAKQAMWAKEYLQCKFGSLNKVAFNPALATGGIASTMGINAVAENEARNKQEVLATQGGLNLKDQLYNNLIATAPAVSAALGYELGHIHAHDWDVPGLMSDTPPHGLAGYAGMYGGALAGGLAGIPISYALGKHIAHKRLQHVRQG